MDLDKSPSVGIIDDSDIKNLINPGATSAADESAEYLAIRMSEKLTINLIQCLAHTGIVVLQDQIRSQVLEQYLTTEKKLRFRNKGLLYLLTLFEKDVSKLLQFSRHRKAI